MGGRFEGLQIGVVTLHEFLAMAWMYIPFLDDVVNTRSMPCINFWTYYYRCTGFVFSSMSTISHKSFVVVCRL